MTRSGKHCGKRRNCTFFAISSFITMFLNSRLLQRRQKASIWGKGLYKTVTIVNASYRVYINQFSQQRTFENLKIEEIIPTNNFRFVSSMNQKDTCTSNIIYVTLFQRQTTEHKCQQLMESLMIIRYWILNTFPLADTSEEDNIWKTL